MISPVNRDSGVRAPFGTRVGWYSPTAYTFAGPASSRIAVIADAVSGNSRKSSSSHGSNSV